MAKKLTPKLFASLKRSPKETLDHYLSYCKKLWENVTTSHSFRENRAAFEY